MWYDFSLKWISLKLLLQVLKTKNFACIKINLKMLHSLNASSVWIKAAWCFPLFVLLASERFVLKRSPKEFTVITDKTHYTLHSRLFDDDEYSNHKIIACTNEKKDSIVNTDISRHRRVSFIAIAFEPLFHLYKFKFAMQFRIGFLWMLFLSLCRCLLLIF